MSSITSIFYNDNCYLMHTVLEEEPNEYGIVKKTNELISSLPVACTFSPISTLYAQQKYGVNISQSFEISFDIDPYIHVENVSAIMVNKEVYEVVSYQVFSEFMILPASVTFLVKKV